MMIYKKPERFPFKWVLALLVFVMILTVTWSDVDGLNTPTTTGFRSIKPDSNSNSTLYTPSMTTSVTVYPNEYIYPDDGDDSDDPSETPETSTLVLLICGLSAMFFALRFRN
ncbi:MAG: hypothetical protein U9R56_01755 [candidate division Zixibacteria bacterium]|nr:hypothetical protein [candidate division Zixibacteria bacterium]